MADRPGRGPGRLGHRTWRAIGVRLAAMLGLGFLLALGTPAGAHALASGLLVARPAAEASYGVRLAPMANAPLIAPRGVPAATGPSSTPSATTDGGLDLNSIGGDTESGRSSAVTIIILMTVLSVAPALLLLCTSFTKIAIVLSLTRNALGTPTIPPNQVLAGLSLFLSLFIMGPVFSQVNDQAVQPYLNSKISTEVAVDRAMAPMKTFMLKQTGATELQTMITASKEKQPADKKDVSMLTLIPAFILSELKAAFIIGFVIFIPFLVIDIVVSSVLMSMGMMMLPPVMISLPFKILLFVMVDGWSLIATTLVGTYR